MDRMAPVAPLRRTRVTHSRSSALLAAAFVAFAALPAGAHGVVGQQPTNIRSRILSVSPDVAGLHVWIRDLGQHIAVHNDTGTDVVILGYDNEPYLRVGPGGVFENQRSPAVFLNRTRTIVADAPASFDASAPPEWKQIGSGQTVAWHDHRVHYMGVGTPPAVGGSSNHAHLVSIWRVELRYRGQPVVVRGELRWIPGPSPLPRLGLALGAALLVGLLGFTRRWAVVAFLSLIALVVIVTMLIGGQWSATSADAWNAFLSTAYSILGAAVALSALGAIVRSRREPANATAMILVAAVVLMFGSGLANVTTLARSQLPTTLTPSLARTFVALVLGLSTGLLVTAARHLRRPAVLTVPPAPSHAAPAAPVPDDQPA